MAFYLSAKKLDITSGDNLTVLINEADAEELGIHAGDYVELNWTEKENPINALVDTTDTLVDEGEVGFYEDVWFEQKLKDKLAIAVNIAKASKSIEGIRKKLSGHKLSYEEIYEIIDDIAHHRLSPVLSTFFVAGGYSPGLDDEEIYFSTKALANTGDILKFDGIVADKHSIGGVAGKGITPIVIPVVAAAGGIIVPNTSTRAVTSASATTDMLEVIMPMSFSREQLEAMIIKSSVFMVWGGGIDLAPADDEIIKIQKPLGMESVDKFVASIVAKKIAQGVNHVIFDVPVGPSAKITEAEFEDVKAKFDNLCAKFGIKNIVHKRFVTGIDGRAVGPSLECREFLRVYEQHPERSLQLENDALEMAGKLLELCGKAENGKGFDFAKELLISGKATAKLREIIRNQGGNENITSEGLELGALSQEKYATEEGVIKSVNNKEVFAVARALGNPRIKEAGIYFHKLPGDTVKKGDLTATIYATSDARLNLASKVWDEVAPFDWE